MAAASAVAVPVVRQRVAAVLSALTGWNQSPYALDEFGRDTDQLQHHAFAVGVPSTDTHPQAGRRRLTEGLLVVSAVEVRFAHRLKVDDQVGSYDLALVAEREAIGAVLTNADRTGLSALVWDRTRRQSPGQGWLLFTLTFTAVHRI
jgi:hypothetical protein